MTEVQVVIFDGRGTGGNFRRLLISASGACGCFARVLWTPVGIFIAIGLARLVSRFCHNDNTRCSIFSVIQRRAGNMNILCDRE